MVSRATGLSRPVISQGIKELQEGAKVGEGRMTLTESRPSELIRIGA